MVPQPSTRTVGIVLATVAVTLLLAGSVNSLPGFSDHTGPSELTVASFERVGAQCDSAPQSVGSATQDGTYARTGTIRTADTDADLSVHVERTSLRGADLSTFRVYVESHHTGPVEADCENVALVGYRIELEPGGGSPPGILPDDHGVRIQYYENGEPAGCSASYTGGLGLDAGCGGTEEHPRRTWANATG